MEPCGAGHSCAGHCWPPATTAPGYCCPYGDDCPNTPCGEAPYADVAGDDGAIGTGATQTGRVCSDHSVPSNQRSTPGVMPSSYQPPVMGVPSAAQHPGLTRLPHKD